MDVKFCRSAEIDGACIEMNKITSLQNPRFKSALKLHTSRGRNQQNQFIIFGMRECRRAIESNIAPLSVFACPQILDPESLNWLRTNVPAENCFEITSEMSTKLEFGSRTEGVAVVAQRPCVDLEPLKIDNNCLMVVLEAIEKPGNLGAILRSCDGAGVDVVVTANPLTDFFHPNCIRASMGAVFSMSLGSGETTQVRSFLNDAGFDCHVAIVGASKTVHEAEFTAQRCALVFGNEATGLSEVWQSENNSGIRIPMRGIGDSLNVSVSAAIVAYEAARQRS